MSEKRLEERQLLQAIFNLNHEIELTYEDLEVEPHNRNLMMLLKHQYLLLNTLRAKYEISRNNLDVDYMTYTRGITDVNGRLNFKYALPTVA